jgi:transposase
MNPYEEINNKLKLIKKKLGYGFHKFENFKLQRLLTWHFGINYQYTEQ